MSKISDKHGRIRRGKPRDLYNDADSEQAEGLATPSNEPMRDVVKGRSRNEAVEKPHRAAENRSRRAIGRS